MESRLGPADSLTAIDLFCGCGGLTQGLRDAHFKVLGAVDIDELAVETYRANHGEHVAHIWRSPIQKLSARKVKERLGLKTGELDLLAGCPPCEGFSRLRTLNGAREVQDTRNDLVFHLIRFANVLRPKAIMMENVPGLATDARMTEVLRRLRRYGYAFKGETDDEARSRILRILNTAHFNVPQRRRRMVLLAGRGFSLEFAAEVVEQRNVEDTIGQLPPPDPANPLDPLHDYAERRSERIRRLIAGVPKDGGSRTDLDKVHQLECHKRCNGFRDVYGRMAWQDVAPTITSGCTNPSKGRFLHPEQNRAVTLREAALLQTFPENYSFSMKRGKQGVASLVGDALPPEFIRLHALSMRKQILRWNARRFEP